VAVEPDVRRVSGRPLVEGAAAGPVLVLERPLSFWGGVDPMTGHVSDPRHPQYGSSVAGRVLMMERAVGSSSSSAIMLELIRNQVAPAAVVMGKADAILALGVLVARELGYETLPMMECPELDYGARELRGAHATVHPGGVTLRWDDEA